LSILLVVYDTAMDDETTRILELIAETDSLVLDGRWDDVVALRDRCRAAVQRGHQWWPAAAWAEYRMALDGPGALAATVLDSLAARYTLGPFAEVAASTHTWDELATHLPGTPGSAAFAHECIALGDDLRADDMFTLLPQVFDLPPFLQAWEPQYGPVTYHLDRVEHHLDQGSSPDLHQENSDSGVGAGPDGQRDDPAATDALRALVRPWSHAPENMVRVVSCAGDARTALHALGCRSSNPYPVSGHHALSSLAWIGASGGPHGRRRGLSSSRSDLWWSLLQICGFADGGEDFDVPLSMADADTSLLEDFAGAIDELRWFTWTEATQPQPPVANIVNGWEVRVIVEDPIEGLSWGLSAEVRQANLAK
jgi:hypothetical protein